MRKAILVAAAVLLLAVVVWAQRGGNAAPACGSGPGMGMGMGPGMGMGMGMKMDGRGCCGRGDGCGMRGQGQPGLGRILMAAEELKLTDEQRGKLEGMMTTFQKERIGRRAELEKAEVDLRALMRDDKASEGAVNAAIDKVAGLKADLQKMHYAHWHQAKAVLTGEQIAKLKDLRKERRKEVVKEFRIQRSGSGPGDMPEEDEDD